MSREDASVGVPFSFFASLLREISKSTFQQAHSNVNSSTYPSLKTFQRWIVELRRRYNPLPLNTTAIIFRLLFPEEDSRRKYDMQEMRLASYIGDALVIQRLSAKDWKTEGASGCLGYEVKKILDEVYPTTDSGISPLSLSDVDALLDELASTSGFSHASIRSRYPADKRRRRTTIIRLLYRSLSPLDASFVTQIILKDLRPLLYPLLESHYTAALTKYNTNSVRMLSIRDAMKVWDPSGRMLQTYRTRRDLLEISDGLEPVQHPLRILPKVGVPLEIPKSKKGSSCAHALSLLGQSAKVWAEIKYDGERAQIHVEVFVDNTSKITIFSKSGRDSTDDRYGVHSIIRDALGLPQSRGSSARLNGRVKQNVILDAEMVAYSENINRIDEFWRIRSLIESTAHGIRGTRPMGPTSTPIEPSYSFSQSSLISDVSDSRHLALVFFDVLVLDSEPLLSRPYRTRRSILESIIQIIPGQAMLTERTPIDLTGDTKQLSSEEQLCEAFAKVIADHQEGLVLKADEAMYNDYKMSWVKLKRDYIPGYGDTIDLVLLGAAWDKERGRELRVGPSALTTFYVGALDNATAIQLNPAPPPRFHVYFTVSYGMTRAELEQINFLVKNCNSIPYTTTQSAPNYLGYTFTLYSGLKPPTVMFNEPILVELFGAGFTKAPKSKHYELRFPRISKIYRTAERTWRDGVSLKELHQIARTAVGRDRKNKDIDDWGNITWGRPVSPSIRSTPKRKREEEKWKDKLMMLSRKDKRRKQVNSVANVSPARYINKDDDLFLLRVEPLSHVVQPLGTSTNIERSPNSPLATRSLPIHSSQQDHISTSVYKSPSPTSNIRTLCRRNAITGLACTNSTPLESVKKSMLNIPTEKSQSLNSTGDASELKITTDIPAQIMHPGSLEQHPPTAELTAMLEAPSDQQACGIKLLADFLNKALIWFAGARDGSQRMPRPGFVPSNHRLHSFESLLVGCGWSAGQPQFCDWIDCGVVFVDDSEGRGKVWKEYVLEKLEGESIRDFGLASKRKPIWLFDSTVLSTGLGEGGMEGYAMHRAL